LTATKRGVTLVVHIIHGIELARDLFLVLALLRRCEWHPHRSQANTADVKQGRAAARVTSHAGAVDTTGACMQTRLIDE
jgi:hypothetical protein